MIPSEITRIYNPILAEVFFAIIGLVFIANGVKAFRDTTTAKHVTTGLFWVIMGVCFIVGKYIPSWIVGVLIVVSAVLTAIGGVVQTKNDVPSKEETRANADRIGYKIFIPALMLALVSVIAAALGLVSGNNAIGVSAIFGAIAVFAITKAPAKSIVTEGNRLLDNMGSVAFLPQLLAAGEAALSRQIDVHQNQVTRLSVHGHVTIAAEQSNQFCADCFIIFNNQNLLHIFKHFFWLIKMKLPE